MEDRKKKMIAGFVISGLTLILGLLIYFFLTAYRFTGIVFMGISSVILSYTILYLLSSKFIVVTKVLRIILTSCILIVFFFAVVTGVTIGRHAETQGTTEQKYIVVLGAGVDGSGPSLTLQERIDAAYGYLKAYPDSCCVVSGGQGEGEDITEAECMHRALSAKGISDDRILLEEQASNTLENIRFSLDLIEKETGFRPKQIGLVSSDYHMYRACLIAEHQNVNAVGIPAESTIISLKINYFLREIFAVWYYSLIGG